MAVSRSARKIENPFPHFSEAAEAASQYLSTKREHLLLTAEIRAKREGKRAALGIAALAFAHLTLLLSLFWLSFGIRDAGWSPWAVAVLSFVVLGSVTSLLAYLSKNLGHIPS